MKILLTNDDGFNATGFQTLLNALKPKHEIFVSAPMNQKSGAGHSISLFQAMRYKKINDQIFIVDGSPVDCVKAALFGFFPDIRFDLVISGINNGPNMGDDIFYSGTVAAAREASLNGIPALACSADGYENKQDFSSSASYLLRLLPVLKKAIDQNFILNINFPAFPPYQGTQITELGQRVYSDTIVFSKKFGQTLLTLTGEEPSHIPQTASDLNAVHEGFVSITSLSNHCWDPHFNKFLSTLGLDKL